MDPEEIGKLVNKRTEEVQQIMTKLRVQVRENWMAS